MEIQQPSSIEQATALFTGLTQDQVRDTIKRIYPYPSLNTNLHSSQILEAVSVSGSSKDYREKEYIEAHRLLQGIITNPWNSTQEIEQGKTDPFYYDTGLSDIRDLAQNTIGRVTGAPEVNDPRLSFVKNLLSLKEFQKQKDNDLSYDYVKNLFLTQVENGSTYYQTQALRQNEEMMKRTSDQMISRPVIDGNIYLKNANLGRGITTPHETRKREIVINSDNLFANNKRRGKLDQLHARFSGHLQTNDRTMYLTPSRGAMQMDPNFQQYHPPPPPGGGAAPPPNPPQPTPSPYGTLPNRTRAPAFPPAYPPPIPNRAPHHTHMPKQNHAPPPPAPAPAPAPAPPLHAPLNAGEYREVPLKEELKQRKEELKRYRQEQYKAALAAAREPSGRTHIPQPPPVFTATPEDDAMEQQHGEEETKSDVRPAYQAPPPEEPGIPYYVPPVTPEMRENPMPEVQRATDAYHVKEDILNDGVNSAGTGYWDVTREEIDSTQFQTPTPQKTEAKIPANAPTFEFTQEPPKRRGPFDPEVEGVQTSDYMEYLKTGDEELLRKRKNGDDYEVANEEVYTLPSKKSKGKYFDTKFGYVREKTDATIAARETEHKENLAKLKAGSNIDPEPLISKFLSNKKKRAQEKADREAKYQREAVERRASLRSYGLNNLRSNDSTGMDVTGGKTGNRVTNIVFV